MQNVNSQSNELNNYTRTHWDSFLLFNESSLVSLQFDLIALRHTPNHTPMFCFGNKNNLSVFVLSLFLFFHYFYLIWKFIYFLPFHLKWKCKINKVFCSDYYFSYIHISKFKLRNRIRVILLPSIRKILSTQQLNLFLNCLVFIHTKIWSCKHAAFYICI